MSGVSAIASKIIDFTGLKISEVLITAYQEATPQRPILKSFLC
jgi:hypothetical protein